MLTKNAHFFRPSVKIFSDGIFLWKNVKMPLSKFTYLHIMNVKAVEKLYYIYV